MATTPTTYTWKDDSALKQPKPLSLGAAPTAPADAGAGAFSASVNGAAPPAPPAQGAMSFRDLAGPNSGLTDPQLSAFDAAAKPIGTNTQTSQNARSELDKQNSETLRQTSDDAALAGRAGTGQVLGDRRILANEAAAKKGDLEGSLAASAETVDNANKQEALKGFQGALQSNINNEAGAEENQKNRDLQDKEATAQRAMEDEHFASQLGLNKDQLAENVRVNTAQIQNAAAQLGLSTAQQAQLLKDDNVSQAMNMATTLSTLYGDDPDTQFRSAGLVFKAMLDGGYMTQAQYDAGMKTAQDAFDKTKSKPDVGGTGTATDTQNAQSYLTSILPKMPEKVTQNQDQIATDLENIATGNLPGAFVLNGKAYSPKIPGGQPKSGLQPYTPAVGDAFQLQVLINRGLPASEAKTLFAKTAGQSRADAAEAMLGGATSAPNPSGFKQVVGA